MFKKILVLGVALIMCLGFFAGCSSGLWFKVDYGEQWSFGEIYGDQVADYPLLRVISSVGEMKALCDERNNPAFLEDSHGYSSNMSKMIRNYDDAYFAEKALVVCLLLGSNAGVSYTVKTITKEEKLLYVHIKRKESKWESATIETPWTVLIVVKKADIFDITGAQFKF